MQDQLRQGREDLKALQAKIAAINQLIEEKDATMADLQRQAHTADGQVSPYVCPVDPPQLANIPQLGSLGQPVAAVAHGL